MNPEGVTEHSTGCKPCVSQYRPLQQYKNPEAGRRDARRAARGDKKIIAASTNIIVLCVLGYVYCVIFLSPLAALRASRLPASGFLYFFSQTHWYTGFTPCAMFCHPFGVLLPAAFMSYDRRQSIPAAVTTLHPPPYTSPDGQRLPAPSLSCSHPH